MRDLQKVYLVAFVWVCLPGIAMASQWRVANAAAFNKASNAAKPGDEIVVLDGTYSNWQVKIHVSGTEDRPIICRAETPHGVRFTGDSRFRITANYGIIRGFVFDSVHVTAGNIIRYSGASENRFTDCRFLSCRNIKWRAAHLVSFGDDGASGSNNNTVDHCIFENFGSQAVGIRLRKETMIPSVFLVIEENRFQNVPPGDSIEAIQIGQGEPPEPGTSALKTYCIVKNNTFSNYRGDVETISIKASYNTIQDNRFFNTTAVMFRFGANNKVTGNYFEDCTVACRITGYQNEFTNNVIKHPIGNAIVLHFGDSKAEIGIRLQAAQKCVVARNRILINKPGVRGIWLTDGGNTAYKVPPEQNRIFDNNVCGGSGNLYIVSEIRTAQSNAIERNTYLKKCGD